MKKMLMIPGVVMVLMLANPVMNAAQAQTKKKAQAAAGAKASPADIAAGKELLSTSDCLACHKVDVKLVGPAYIDVAKKYPANEANYNKLAKKIIAGGAGAWGDIPMSPHPALSMADAKKMVKYILSVK
ncbi:cytochrome c class I [Mucilaginibacter hurinus]|uniref:Cytochrome c class I n=1 Tax=Mucilaginibacter hurinus TaxID=2201324 RepID=A0A367GPB9_9SPHI|nr:c-type cytochrome [Mucilaginibacter hurinus]RCH54895.1 cytochrome c class I [Mucilaginibacter hurinus]